MSTALLLVFEVTGTVAFAISGAITAIQHELDYFGVFLLVATTSTDGGVLRGIILGVSPPAGLMNPICLIVVPVIVLPLLALSRLRRLVSGGNPIYTWSYYISGALGLVVLIVVGVGAVVSAGYEKKAFLCIFVTMLTGVGGGMVRDILVQRTSVTLRHEICALASAAGELLCYLTRTQVPQSVAVLLSILLTVSTRMLSLYFNIHIPSTASQGGQEEPDTSE